MGSGVLWYHGGVCAGWGRRTSRRKGFGMAEPRVFIFDCDGTLLDSMGMWLSCQPKLLASYGISTTPADFARFEHLAFEDECAAYHETWGIGASGQDVAERFNKIMEHEYRTAIHPMPGAVALVQAAAARGIALAIATSTPAHLVRLGLEANGLDAYFPEITTTGEAGRSKEFPDVYDLALQRACARCGLGKVARSDAWVFEDAPFGLTSAGAAGYNTVGIYDPAGRGTREAVFELADLPVDSLEEISLDQLSRFMTERAVREGRV